MITLLCGQRRPQNASPLLRVPSQRIGSIPNKCLAVIFGAHYEVQILDRSHHDERPEYQRKNTEQILDPCPGPTGSGHDILSVERAGSDVAENHSEGSYGKSSEGCLVAGVGSLSCREIRRCRDAWGLH
jgi:hypothetical protein